MKTVGIIGGFGPETTAKFMMRILSLWANTNTGLRPEILLWNAPVNEKGEKMFISTGTGSEAFKNLLIVGAKKLERAGANFLVLPCNSLHIFINQIRLAVKVPVLSIVELTSQEISNGTSKKIGFLSTSATRKSGMFEKALKNTTLIRLDQKEQVALDTIIQDLVSGSSTNATLKFKKILSTFSKQGIRQILLACTDLHLLKAKACGFEFIDTLEILASKTALKMAEN